MALMYNMQCVTQHVTEPDHPCHISSYFLDVEEVGSTSHIRKSVSSLPFQMTGLKPYTNYTWMVIYGNNTISTDTLRTLEGAPEAPVNLEAIETSSHSMSLTWEHPNITNGIIRRFEVQVKLVSSKLRKQEGETKFPEYRLEGNNMRISKVYSYKVEHLWPSSQYEVSVRGVTLEPGITAVLTVNTSSVVPNVGSQLKLVHNLITNTTLQVVIPSADRFLTASSSYFVIVMSDREEVVENDSVYLLKPKILSEHILREAKVENDGHSWIAAEIKPEDEERHFTVGDNSTSGLGDGYWNRPLTPGVQYQVTLVAVNGQDGEYKYSFVRLEHPVQALSEPKPGDGSRSEAGWAALLLLLLLPGIVYFIIRRKQMKKKGDTLELKANDVLYGNQGGSTENITGLDLETEGILVKPKLAPSQRFSRRVAIGELEKYVKEGLTSGELQRQHALFPRGQTRPWDYGRLPQNKAKNRYGNLVAYDETRVKLKKLPEDQFSDYINANYINGYNSPNFYIATQGPKRNTVVDFWRMIWQEHVQVIAMLANIVESGKLKCEQYWPEIGQEVLHGCVSVLNVSSQVFADFTFRVLNVTCKGKTRKIQHLHFTSWPDHGVPLYPQSVASYLKKLLAAPKGSGPIVVHCSAGVGRTGTIILSDVCLRMAAAERYVDVLAFQQQIREHRANMVDNFNQYKFVHLVLLECLVTEPSSVTCDGYLEKHVNELRQTGAMLRQFKRMHELSWQDQALSSTSVQTSHSQVPANKSKNRSQKIVPGQSGRLFITRYPFEDVNSEYINAVYVDGFRLKDQFVATQFPLTSTVGDFWRLIAEKNVSLIVVLNEVETQIKNVCAFWPMEQQSHMNPVPYIRITLKLEDKATHWSTHTISFSENDAASKPKDRIVHILQLNGWKSNEMLPPSTSVMLQFWHETERLYGGNGPIVVTCLDGANACGYFLALAFLVEKIKLEQECDVCHAVRMVRQNREQFVPTFEQFESLYEAAITYLNSFQTYANFN
ncbi:receptor-type tyrosine-protein phosphatase epsilon isoform X3 [Cryptotermes secundus]|uniref:receptor-type tyrosine-protein phosphatase epsilon isoform X3 n=1 Tax=Cryptotermes secundus TaxID=105785 RepID=UPI000CD7C151|nr:receptor-type tyrosine-protein phosphatase epsilon isoform X3 [Cryptotermes secundus]